jgi:DNA-binding transcriptional regulator GbsR (MarR family)
MPEKPPKIHPELEDVVAQIGEFIEYWGFKNVHGRIWAHLYLSDEPLDASDLISRLQISKALVSMSISDLMDYDVVHVAGKSCRGTVTYCANPNVTSVVLGVLRKRERRLLSRIAGATKVLKDYKNHSKDEVTLSNDRVQSLHEMVLTAEESMDALLILGDVDFKEWGRFDEDSDEASVKITKKP